LIYLEIGGVVVDIKLEGENKWQTVTRIPAEREKNSEILSPRSIRIRALTHPSQQHQSGDT